MIPSFQFGLRQLLFSVFWLAVALGLISHLMSAWGQDGPPSFLFQYLILIPAATGGGVGVLLGRAVDGAIVGIVGAPIGMMLLAIATR